MFHQPILIISPPRSGSSLFSNIISDAGVFGGITKPANEFNINGYFENVGITKLIVSYLKRCDISGLGKKYQPLGLSVPYPALAADCYKVIYDEGYVNGMWYFKDPKLCWTWQMFHAAFPEAKWVIVDRDKEQVLSSYRRTPFMDAYDGRTAWELYLNRALQNISMLERSAKNVHRVNINRVIEGDKAEIESVMKYLNIETGNINCINNHVWNGN
jgi:hypothetical protein